MSEEEESAPQELLAYLTENVSPPTKRVISRERDSLGRTWSVIWKDGQAVKAFPLH